MFEVRPHPGPRHPLRRIWSEARQAVHLRAVLDSGLSLYQALFQVLDAAGISAASLSLFGGGFKTLVFTTGAIETRPDSARQANYTTIRDWTGCALLYGAGTAGIDPHASPLFHCHAVFSDATGRTFGGHLFPEKSILSEPVIAHVTGHPGLVIKQSFDPETHHSVFQPVVEPARGSVDGKVLDVF